MKVVNYLSRVLVIVTLAVSLSACMFFPPHGGGYGGRGHGGGPGPGHFMAP